ncbi:MAG: fused MFS/spermidine synthase, partial [Acidobacteria bacterium]|nr:fused MFS/spermidine synthase [Acidobacteriota bacterium]
QERREIKAPAKAKATEGMPVVLPLYAASGFVAMVYEITWTRVMAPIAGSSVYSFTLILAAVLAGIGVGSLVLSTRVGRWIHPGRGFVAGQILLGTVAFGSMWGLQQFPQIMMSVAAHHPSDPQGFLLWEFLAFGAIVLAPAILLGALFPFASRLLHTLETEAGADVGRVYAWNTAGSLFGSLAAGFFLVETLGSRNTLALACLTSICLGLAGLILAPGKIFRPVAGLSAAALALLIPLFTPSWNVYMMTTGVTQLLRNIRKMGHYATVEQILAFAQAPDVHILFHKEGKTNTVTVVREWTDVWLRVDGKTDASTSSTDMLTQSLLGQLPFFFARNPQSVAVIGYGSGVTAHAVLT